MPRPDRQSSQMVIAKHVILSEVEESPVYSIGLNAKNAVNTFARRRRRPFGFVSMTVPANSDQCISPVAIGIDVILSAVEAGVVVLHFRSDRIPDARA